MLCGTLEQESTSNWNLSLWVKSAAYAETMTETRSMITSRVKVYLENQLVYLIIKKDCSKKYLQIKYSLQASLSQKPTYLEIHGSCTVLVHGQKRY